MGPNCSWRGGHEDRSGSKCYGTETVVLDGTDEGDGGQVFGAAGLGEGQSFRGCTRWVFGSRGRVGVAPDRGRRPGPPGKVLREGRYTVDAELVRPRRASRMPLVTRSRRAPGSKAWMAGSKVRWVKRPSGIVTWSEDAGAVVVAKDGGLAAGVDVGEEAKGRLKQPRKVGARREPPAECRWCG